MKKGEVKVSILGSGTSTGVPTIACPCEVCKSTHPRNKRTRASVLLTHPESNTNLVIDTGPDFRSQILRHQVTHLEYALFTHTHADHCHGFDDVRAFYFYNKVPVSCWIHKRHAMDFRARFAYVFEETGYIGTKPQVLLHEIENDPFAVGVFEVEPVSLPHGSVVTTAYRIGRFAYATDFKKFPEDVIKKWRGKIDLMVASGVGFKEHPTHSTLPETVELFKNLEVKRGVVTHLSHVIEYERDSKILPPHIELAYDGLELNYEF